MGAGEAGTVEGRRDGVGSEGGIVLRGILRIDSDGVCLFLGISGREFNGLGSLFCGVCFGNPISWVWLCGNGCRVAGGTCRLICNLVGRDCVHLSGWDHKGGLLMRNGNHV